MSLSIVSAETEQERSQLLAPIWHTLTLVVTLVALSAYGAHMAGSAHPLVGSQRLVRYLLMIAIEWAMVAFVVWGIKGRMRVRELIGGKWMGPTDLLRDFGIGFSFLLATYVVMIMLVLVLRPGHSVGLERLMPHTRPELWLFMAVASSAGFAEEIIFRGYLQKQLLSVWGGEVSIFLQAVVFGAAHGYQGTKRMLMLGVLGLLLGMLARRRRSLRPGMIAHGMLDMVGGVLFFLRH